VTKGADLQVAALENEGVACNFAIPGEETIFRFFCVAVFIHVSSRDFAHIHSSPSETNALLCDRFGAQSRVHT
jgi:hypothetical protein